MTLLYLITVARIEIVHVWFLCPKLKQIRYKTESKKKHADNKTTTEQEK